MVSVTTRQPSPHSGVSAAAGPRLLIRQVQYLLSSQLTFISEGSSPIRRLGMRLVAYSSAPTYVLTIEPNISFERTVRETESQTDTRQLAVCG